MTINRLTSKKISETVVDAAIAKIVSGIVEVFTPEWIILFGSAAEGQVTDQSDLDFLIVTSTVDEIRQHQKSLKHLQKLTQFPLDLVWVDLKTYERKREIGGVCMIASEDGKILFKRAFHD